MTRQCSRCADLRDQLRPRFIAFLRGPFAFAAFSIVVVGLAAWAFYAPALAKTHGLWPVPLDDVYIHFDFARSAASGHPFSWLVGNGYSSGGTSLTYPLVLALGYLVGFRGLHLGAFAAFVAVASLVDASFSLRKIGQREIVVFVAPLLLVVIPLLDWTWFSGMEVALASALLLRALSEAVAVSSATPERRGAHQLRAGLYLAALSVTRPECVALVIPLAVAIAHASDKEHPLKSLARAAGPAAVILVIQAWANWLFTGDVAAAGALRKLATENPYDSGADVVVLFLTNFVRLRTEGIELALGGPKGAWLLILLGVVGIADRRLGRFALALLLGAGLALCLVCLNTTAPFQNMRYVAPTLLMLLSAAFIGIAFISRKGRAGRVVAFGAFVVVALFAAPTWSRQIDHFGRASRNIAEQQVEVGKRLAALPERPRRVFVGDAGAIPYVSELPALDGLGLGGYHDLPFARASVLGVPAVIELIERLPPEARPDILAVYDSWWPGLVPAFGKPLFSVTIDDNVICGDKTKSVYQADWSLLEDRTRDTALDRIDIGDLVDEREHAFSLPGPHTGYVIGAILEDADGLKHFDAGRIIPEDAVAQFALRGKFLRGAHSLVLVTDGGHSADVVVEARTENAATTAVEITLPDVSSERWSEVMVPLNDVAPGSEIRLRPTRGPLRAFSAFVR